MNGTDMYIETVKYLAKLYDFCNAKLFNGELQRPVITIQRDERNKTNGWFSLQKVWKWQDFKPANCCMCERRDECVEDLENPKYINCKTIEEREDYELNITAQQLNRPIGAIAATMIHEMVHQFAKVNNLQDTSRSGSYHNKLFKRLAENHGLNVECMPTIGWSHTTLTPSSEKLIAEFVKDNPDNIIYRLPVFKGQSVKSTSTRKYECPCCGNSVRATKQINLICGDCNQPMVEDKD